MCVDSFTFYKLLYIFVVVRREDTDWPGPQWTPHPPLSLSLPRVVRLSCTYCCGVVVSFVVGFLVFVLAGFQELCVWDVTGAGSTRYLDQFVLQIRELLLSVRVMI